MSLLRGFERVDPWRGFRRRATEGIATWLSRLPGGVGAYLPAAASPREVRDGAARLHAFVRDRVTTNPVTREPLSPVQIHLLELVLEAVDWPALTVAAEMLATDESGVVVPIPPTAGGPMPRRAELCRGDSS